MNNIVPIAGDFQWMDIDPSLIGDLVRDIYQLFNIYLLSLSPKQHPVDPRAVFVASGPRTREARTR